ncbi:MAG: hypothetical protein M5U28_11415 [Sandaracinaceae bacterium]|nr:hypothetical protein [Sandaracinaceae bacterium]
MSTVHPPKCAQCGLVNPVSQSTCRRCAAPLDAAARRSVAPDEATEAGAEETGWRKVVASIAGGCLGAIVFALWTTPPARTSNGVVLHAATVGLGLVCILVLNWTYVSNQRRNAPARAAVLLFTVVAVVAAAAVEHGRLRRAFPSSEEIEATQPAEPLLVSYRGESNCAFSVHATPPLPPGPRAVSRVWTHHVRVPPGTHTTLVVGAQPPCESGQRVLCSIEVTGTTVVSTSEVQAPAEARCALTVAAR